MAGHGRVLVASGPCDDPLAPDTAAWFRLDGAEDRRGGVGREAAVIVRQDGRRLAQPPTRSTSCPSSPSRWTAPPPSAAGARGPACSSPRRRRPRPDCRPRWSWSRPSIPARTSACSAARSTSPSCATSARRSPSPRAPRSSSASSRWSSPSSSSAPPGGCSRPAGRSPWDWCSAAPRQPGRPGVPRPGVPARRRRRLPVVFAPDGRVWPVFNVADSAIVCGGVLGAVLALRGIEFDGTRTPRRARKRSRPDPVGRAQDRARWTA